MLRIHVPVLRAGVCSAVAAPPPLGEPCVPPRLCALPGSSALCTDECVWGLVSVLGWVSVFRAGGGGFQKGSGVARKSRPLSTDNISSYSILRSRWPFSTHTTWCLLLQRLGSRSSLYTVPSAARKSRPYWMTSRRTGALFHADVLLVTPENLVIHKVWLTHYTGFETCFPLKHPLVLGAKHISYPDFGAVLKKRSDFIM